MSACAFGPGDRPQGYRKREAQTHLAKGVADAAAGVLFFGLLVGVAGVTAAVGGALLVTAPAWFVPVALLRAEEHKFRGVVQKAAKPEPPSGP